MRHFPRPAPSAPALLCAASMAMLAGCAHASDGSTTTAPAASSTSAAGSTALPAQVPASVLHDPLGCPRGTDALILQRVSVSLPRAVTVVLARCDSGAGSPPTGVYLVDGTGSTASVAGVLVRPDQDLEIADLTATAGGLRATGLGYSGPNVPRCCPDRRVVLGWRVVAGALVPTI